MREKHREPEVPGEGAPVGECIHGLARITSKELATTHFVKGGTLQNACSRRPRVDADFGEMCSYAHRQVDEQPSKRSKKKDDKSAVVMLKKNDWHENVREPVVNHTIKSIPPNTENSLQYGYDEHDNNNMSNETKRGTNYSTTKWNDVNTHNYTQLTKYNKYTNDDIYTNACVVRMIH